MQDQQSCRFTLLNNITELKLRISGHSQETENGKYIFNKQLILRPVIKNIHELVKKMTGNPVEENGGGKSLGQALHERDIQKLIHILKSVEKHSLSEKHKLKSK